MSRIGKKPIALPAKVEVSVSPANEVTVKGPKGTLRQLVNKDIKVSVENNQVVLTRPTDERQHRALHGLYRSIINSMVIGVNEGYKKDLELVGVGYKATCTGNLIELSLGYSHLLYFVLPNEVKGSAVTEKGKNPIITLECPDKQLIGQIAAKIKSLRKVEPYKGKGIRFVGEYVRRKAGKTASK